MHTDASYMAIVISFYMNFNSLKGFPYTSSPKSLNYDCESNQRDGGTIQTKTLSSVLSN
jgi:hypothetical protein